MSEAIDRLNARLAATPASASGHLSFQEKCAAFYLLQRGFKQALVAEVFGVTPAAVNRLAQCLTPGARKYKTVADEWARIGDADEFGRLYYTLDIDDRVARARADEPRAGDLRRGRGPNPNASGPDSMQIAGELVRVVWIEDTTLPGWYIIGEQTNIGLEYFEGGDHPRPFRNKMQGYRLAQKTWE